MLDFGLVRAIGLQAAARVSRKASGSQIKFAGRAVAAHARQGLVGNDLFPACEAGTHPFDTVFFEHLDR
jgi:hypothetical protein